jgi:hypothetical protein
MKNDPNHQAAIVSGDFDQEEREICGLTRQKLDLMMVKYNVVDKFYLLIDETSTTQLLHRKQNTVRINIMVDQLIFIFGQISM